MRHDAPRARIDRVWARNFRSVATLDLELGDLTVLVGRNGTGKSNTVRTLRFLRDCEVVGFEKAVHDEGGTGVLKTKGTDYVEVGIEASGFYGCARYWVILSAGGAGGRREEASVKPEGHRNWTTVRSGGEEAEWETVGEDRMGRPILHRLVPHVEGRVRDGAVGEGMLEGVENTVGEVVDSLRSMSFYDFSPSALKEPQRPSPPPLDDGGSNLTTVLASALTGPDGSTFQQSLRLLVDGTRGLEVRDLGSYLIAEVLYDAGGDGAADLARFDLGLESDGTVRLIAILAALYQSPPRSLVVIEEPERNIHPGALAILADVIREASTRMQIVVTTHSPDLIDHFDPDDIRVVERVDGATTVGRMDATQREAVRSKLFSTGELLRMEGLYRESA